MRDPPDCCSPHRHNLPPPRRSTRRRRYSAPSPGLLSLLATVVASSSTVDGSPLSFLCPSLGGEEVISPISRHSNTFNPTSSAATTSSTERRRIENRRQRLPPKYETGDDGLWRKANTYSLYGSTMCKVTINSTGPFYTCLTLFAGLSDYFIINISFQRFGSDSNLFRE